MARVDRLLRPVAAAVVLVAVIVIAWIGLIFVTGNVGRANVADLVSGGCTIGLTGAAVSIEAEGLGSSSECDSLARTTTDGASWYRYADGTEAAGAVICQGKVGDVTFTVRDQGMLNLYGTNACNWLVDRGATLP